MRLADKTVVITGAGRGLGRECARLFAEEGASLVVTDVLEAEVEETAEMIRKDGGRATALRCDVSKLADHEAAVAKAVEEFGKLDVYYNNAGIAPRGNGSIPFEDLTEEDLVKNIEVNFTAAVFTAKAAIPQMRAQGYGNILYTSSASSLVGFPQFSIYGACKAGVNGLVRGLAVDLGKFNIRVNCIAPLYGMSAQFIMPDAPANTSYNEAVGFDTETSGMPLKGTVAPSLRDNAYGALYLASDESKWMSGVSIPTTDGGALSRISG